MAKGSHPKKIRKHSANNLRNSGRKQLPGTEKKEQVQVYIEAFKILALGHSDVLKTALIPVRTLVVNAINEAYNKLPDSPVNTPV